MNGATILTKFTADTKDLDSKTKTAKSKLTDFAKGIGTAFLAGTGIAIGALSKLTTDSVKAFAAVEQSIGGVETLFKDSADIVIENAERAYKTAGISANQYMEQVTSFSASLLQSLGGDTEKASKIADMAIIDMADNANKMGTSIEAIQTAYQGFAKQNYTMLDNLKLGYGGTRTEMERLLADAEKISGIHYDISNLNEVYEAIHIIQGELGITGTTAVEASTTIIGSVSSAKAAFQNFLAGTGGIEEVIETFITAGKNIANAIIKMLPQIVEGIVGLMNGLLPMLPDLIKALLPGLITGAIDLVIGLIEILPDIILMIAEMLPTMLPQIIDAIMQIIPMLIEMLPEFIIAGAKLLGGLLEGIIKSYPILWEGVKNIWEKIKEFLAQIPSMLVKTGNAMIQGLWNGIKGMKDWVINKVKDLGASILKGLKGILGIKSPSKEFAIIGKFSVLGYTEALDDMSKDVEKQVGETFGISPQLASSSALSYTPNVQVVNNISMKQDPLGQMVNDIKTFSGGSKNDYNYGMGA